MMDMQAAPPTYTPAGASRPPSGNPPMLGAQVPGMTGGLPAQGGLSVLQNPLAQKLQSYGRGDDKMLVHMTPGEVNSLQGLAMAHGGSLTINPDTGLPEAGWLGKLLPTLLGAALAATGVGAPLAAGIVGLGQTVLTGDISKGLMAGLQAFGGGSLAGAAGLGGAISSNAGGILGSNAGVFGANMGAGATAATSAIPAAASNLLGPAGAGSTVSGGIGGGSLLAPAAAVPSASAIGANLASVAPGASSALTAGASGTLGGGITIPTAAKTGIAGFGQRFGQTASAGLGKGMAAKYAPMAAGAGVLSGLSDATAPNYEQYKEGKEDSTFDYKGPYLPQPRTARFRTPEEMRRSGGAEFSFFDDANPYPGFMPAPGMAEGGLAGLPAAGDFQGSMDFFNRSPGAITASMYPTPTPPRATDDAVAAPAAPSSDPGRGERKFAFAAPKEAVPSFGGGEGYFYGGMPFGLGGMPFGINGMGGEYNPAMYLREGGSSFAGGGEVDMKDGSFVVDARTVSEMGNGSSNAGIERLAAMGGRPVRGRGDGVSDSVPARIGGRQKARVARDEVIFSPEAVARAGGGNHSKGTKKLYALVEKAHKARKKAKRGQDTKLAKSIGGRA